MIFKIFYKKYRINILESIKLSFFHILMNTKYSSYDRISKSQKNRAFIKQYSMDI
jgi:hypothetical protein